MARTTLTPITPKGPYPGTVAANDLDYAYAAGDVPNGNQFILTGREILLVKNVNVGAQTFTIQSVADPTYKRTGNVTNYSLGPSEYALFNFFGQTEGWKQTDEYVYLDPGHADIQFAVVRLA